MREDSFTPPPFGSKIKFLYAYWDSVLDLSVGTYLSASWPSVEATDTFTLLDEMHIQSLTVWAANPKFEIGWLDNDGNSVNDQATILYGATVINVFNLCGYVSVSSCLGHGNIFDGRDFKSALTVRGHRGFLVQVRIPNSFAC